MTSEEFDEVVFPGTVCDADTVEVRIPMMGLRDWFAGQALAGMHLPHDYSTGPCNSAAAERCYAVADAMSDFEEEFRAEMLRHRRECERITRQGYRAWGLLLLALVAGLYLAWWWNR